MYNIEFRLRFQYVPTHARLCCEPPEPSLSSSFPASLLCLLFVCFAGLFLFLFALLGAARGSFLSRANCRTLVVGLSPLVLSCSPPFPLLPLSACCFACACSYLWYLICRVVQPIGALRLGPLLKESQAGLRCSGGAPCKCSACACAP